MQARKYSRTYHFPFSPGTTSDDRIAQEWQEILVHELVISEKLDGENTCLKKEGVFARSHGAPTQSAWSVKMRELWQNCHTELGELEVFGESLYAIHSIEYSRLEAYFYVFAIRDGERWLAWDEVVFYANLLQLPTVPVLKRGFFTAKTVEQFIIENIKKDSALGGECEGFVVRTADGFDDAHFKNCVLKYVRKNHVKTDEHWTKNWKRAKLRFELAP
jgi:hypothetical protein